ncbi:MAG: hypothetical protein J5527_12940 [Treponema sp.]|nr:hypothetical protein [Treponema sp.]
MRELVSIKGCVEQLMQQGISCYYLNDYDFDKSRHIEFIDFDEFTRFCIDNKITNVFYTRKEWGNINDNIECIFLVSWNSLIATVKINNFDNAYQKINPKKYATNNL